MVDDSSSRFGPILILGAALVLAGVGAYLLLGGNGEGPPREAPLPEVTREALDQAIERGTRAYIEEYARPSYEHVADGGWLDYTDSEGNTTRLGPEAYMACDIYLVIHYLMYNQQFGVPEDDPFLKDILGWMIDQFDAAQGRWLWSEEGCMHAKGLIALARHGRPDLVKKGWDWALTSPLWLPDEAMFTMMQSGNIVQTLGPATLSLTGRHDWEHGSPVPDPEQSTKMLYAILEAGHTLDDPTVARLNQGLNHYFDTNPLTFMEMNTRDVTGMAWYVFATHKFDLPRDVGYEFCVNTMKQSVESSGTLQEHSLTRYFFALRGMVIRALLLAGVHTPAMDEQISVFLAHQEPDGAWRLSQEGKEHWGLDKPPVIGIKMGQMDGANTYLTTLSLIYYRDAVFPEATSPLNSGPDGSTTSRPPAPVSAQP